MPRRPRSVSPQTEYAVLRDDIDALGERIKPLIAAKATTIQTVDLLRHAYGKQGEIVFDYKSSMVWVCHHDEWYPVGNMVGSSYSNDINGSALSVSISDTPGYLIGWELYNNSAAVPFYVLLYDSASPSGTIIKRIRVPAKGGANIDQVNIKLVNGLSVKAGINSDGSGALASLGLINVSYR
jgi:hypothetical protein